MLGRHAVGVDHLSAGRRQAGPLGHSGGGCHRAGVRSLFTFVRTLSAVAGGECAALLLRFGRRYAARVRAVTTVPVALVALLRGRGCGRRWSFQTRSGFLPRFATGSIGVLGRPRCVVVIAALLRETARKVTRAARDTLPVEVRWQHV